MLISCLRGSGLSTRIASYNPPVSINFLIARGYTIGATLLLSLLSIGLGFRKFIVDLRSKEKFSVFSFESLDCFEKSCQNLFFEVLVMD